MAMYPVGRWFPQYEEVMKEYQDTYRRMTAVKDTMGKDNETYLYLNTLLRSAKGQLDYFEENPNHYE